MNLLVKRLACFVLVIVSFAFFSERASAVERAYSAQGGVQFTGPNDFVGSGNATHLGKYSEAGHVDFAPTKDPTVLAVQGTIVYTAANGDELHASIVGTLNGLTGAVVATLSYTGGTGRFANATGSSQLTGGVSPTGAAQVQVAGRIDY